MCQETRSWGQVPQPLQPLKGTSSQVLCQNGELGLLDIPCYVTRGENVRAFAICFPDGIKVRHFVAPCVCHGTSHFSPKDIQVELGSCLEAILSAESERRGVSLGLAPKSMVGLTCLLHQPFTPQENNFEVSRVVLAILEPFLSLGFQSRKELLQSVVPWRRGPFCIKAFPCRGRPCLGGGTALFSLFPQDTPKERVSLQKLFSSIWDWAPFNSGSSC